MIFPFIKAAFQAREWRVFFALLYIAPFYTVGRVLWTIIFPQQHKRR